MTIHADHSGIARGKFTIPANIPAGVKSVEIIGERGSRGLAQFTGRGEITLEERRRVITVTRYDPLAPTTTLLPEGRPWLFSGGSFLGLVFSSRGKGVAIVCAGAQGSRWACRARGGTQTSCSPSSAPRGSKWRHTEAKGDA